jgi:hypothetical protein
MVGDPSHLLATHTINQIRASLSVLEQLSVLSAPDADAIRTKLPLPNGPFPALSATAFNQVSTTSFNQVTTPGFTSPPALPQRLQPPPQESRGKALWDYTGNVGYGLNSTDNRNPTTFASEREIPL